MEIVSVKFSLHENIYLMQVHIDNDKDLVM